MTAGPKTTDTSFACASLPIVSPMASIKLRSKEQALKAAGGKQIENAKENVNDALDKASNKIEDGADKVKDTWKETKKDVQQGTEKVKKEVKKDYNKAKDEVKKQLD